MKETPRQKFDARGFLVIGGLVVALVVSYGDVVFGGKTLLGSAREAGVFESGPYGYEEEFPGAKSTCIDARSSGGISEPLVLLTSRFWREGAFPLWNPHLGLGMPLAANMQSAVYYPLNLGLWLLPKAWVFDATYLLRLFLAGLFTYLFCRSVGLGRPGSLAAGIAYMLNGYFARHINMFHLNVETLLPLYLYSFERLVKRPSRGNIVVASIAVLLAILGGAPESAFLALLVAGCYFVLRVVVSATGRRLKVLGAFALASGLGVVAGGVLVVPFLEYLRESVNFHPPGTGGNAMPAKLILELAIPRLYGRLNDLLIHENQFFLPAYIGVVPLLLAGLGCLGRRIPRHIICFFAGVAVLGASKTVGVPGISLIGKLPGFDQMTFYKYGMNVITFSVALLCGVGFDAAYRREIPIRVGVGVLTAMLVLGGVGYIVALGEGVPAEHLFREVGLYAGFALIAGAAIAAGAKRQMSKPAGVALLAILAGSLALPVPRPHPGRYEPFAEPPFITYLKEDRSAFRIMGEGILYPDLAAGFGITDMRANDALYPKRYFEVLKRYVAPFMLDRFDGVEEVRHYSPVLDLFNVKYLVTARPLEELDSVTFMKQLLSAGTKSGGGRVGPLAAEVGEGRKMEVLVFEPPAQIGARFPLARGALGLSFNYGAMGVEGVSEGNLVFEVSVKKGERVETVFSDRLSARNQGGHRGTVGLERFGGGEAVLIFSARAEVGSTSARAAWFGIHFEYPPEVSKYEEVYADEAYIYLNKGALARAFFVERARVVEDARAAFAGFAAGWLDSRTEVLLTETPEKVSPETMPIANPECEVVRWGARSTTVEVRAPRSGYVVVSQIRYPGWRAYVDGERTKLLEADYLLMAAQVPAGEHEVEFRYEPASFKLGLGLSVLGVLGMIAIAVPLRRRRLKG